MTNMPTFWFMSIQTNTEANYTKFRKTAYQSDCSLRERMNRKRRQKNTQKTSVSEEKRGDKLSDNSSNIFPFIKLPRALIDDPNFSGLSAEAKLLFSLILDRMGVSQINADRFTDKNGNLFVYYTIQEICLKIGCSHGKAVRLVNELEYHGLIFKQRKGCGKPNKIIVLPSVLRILKTVHYITCRS